MDTAHRLRLGAGLIALGALVVLGRLVQLTVVQGESLSRRANAQHEKRITVTPRRGDILDRYGTPLALSVATESLYVRPRQLPSDVTARVSTLAAALDLSPRQIGRRIGSSAPFAWLKRQASPQEVAEVQALGLSGVGSVESQRRFYPQGTLAAGLLGFTDIDARGLEGVEASYDQYLRAGPVNLSETRDAFGRTIFVHAIEGRPAVRHIKLTVDATLQHVAERELGRAVRESQATAGTVVILDPETFAVRALAQVPTFNPNDPSSVPADFRRNRAVSDCYEPGSTIKTLLLAAALESGVVAADEQLFCEHGSYQVGRHTIKDHKPYGLLSVAEILQYSSNICAAKIGERLGAPAYDAYLRRFGFGRRTGIDLPGEIGGILPPTPSWRRIRLVTSSFGQGIAVTPLQLVSAYAALANGGVLMQPYVVEEVVDSTGHVVVTHRPQEVRRVVSTETARTVLGFLERVVSEGGTGRNARLDTVRVAGKTGTSQKVDPRGGYSATARIASFVGIVPADQPRLVILVAIDEPSKGSVYGGQIAAPVFRAIARHALVSPGVGAGPATNGLRYARGESPDRDRRPPALSYVADLGSAAPSRSPEAVRGPDFVGLSLRAVKKLAHEGGWRITASGSGYVVRQEVQREPALAGRSYALTLAPAGEVSQ